jgi:hypothetical protein
MKNKNKAFIGLISASFIVGAIMTIVGCDGFANQPKEEGGASPERKAGDARFTDGDYIFYFKNGAQIHGDCDGYSSIFGGSTTIYELYQSDINEWKDKLLAIGVKPEVFKTSQVGTYCWIKFDTSLLYGTGLFAMDSEDWHRGNAYFRIKGSSEETRIKWTTGLNFAQAGADFGFDSRQCGLEGRGTNT